MGPRLGFNCKLLYCETCDTLCCGMGCVLVGLGPSAPLCEQRVVLGLYFTLWPGSSLPGLFVHIRSDLLLTNKVTDGLFIPPLYTSSNIMLSACRALVCRAWSCGARLLNDLPADIRQSDSNEVFKSKLKTHYSIVYS